MFWTNFAVRKIISRSAMGVVAGEVFASWGYAMDKEWHKIQAPWEVGLAVNFKDERGDVLTELDDLESDSNREIIPDLSRVDPDQHSELKVVNLFLAFYDESGLMVSLQSWEIDISDPYHIAWIQTLRVPDSAVNMKIMILSDELVPLRAARELA